jgi:putative membrane protein
MSITEAATLAVAAGRWEDGRPDYWPIFPILWLLVIAAIVTTVVLLRRRSHEQAPRRAGEARLAERYAAGEIDEEEFRTRRNVLREK